jgi:hypothetical protein
MIDVDGEEIPTNLEKILERRAVCLFLLCPTGAFFLDTSSPCPTVSHVVTSLLCVHVMHCTIALTIFPACPYLRYLGGSEGQRGPLYL